MLVIIPTQIGEIKKGLKAFKTCGVSDYDYQRHIMFVQVLLSHPCGWSMPGV